MTPDPCIDCDGNCDVCERTAGKAGTMIFLAGSETSFRCRCSANVFTDIEGVIYECNGCGTQYEAIR